MKTCFARSYRWLAVGIVCAMIAFTQAGCTPLKKKFIRQKKKDKEAATDFVPVLEPEVYPVKTAGPADLYAQQYSLLNVWISDFANNFETINNDKRMINALDAALKAVEEMALLLKSPGSEDLNAIKSQILFLREEFAKPASFRNISRMTSELRDIDRSIPKKLKPVVIAQSLRGEGE